MSTITITYGENVENHVGNQQIGQIASSGFTVDQLNTIYNKMTTSGYDCKIIDLCSMLTSEQKTDASPATLLVVKGFVNKFFGANDASTKITNQLQSLNWDKKALMRGKVVNKHARYNLCFADFNQEPVYEAGKGRVYNFANVDYLAKIRQYLKDLLGITLNAEGNYYYDLKKCYIGFHGDAERLAVVGVRFGSDFPLYYQWYHKSAAITTPLKIDLSDGDLYIMSEKTTGNDWKRSSIKTLRHAAGDIKLIT